MTTTSLQLIGGGRMGDALLGGLLAAGAVSLSEVVVVEVSDARRAELEVLRPGVRFVKEVVAADATVLATKPADAVAAAAHAGAAGTRRLLSIAAGVTLASLEAVLPDDCAVIRAMPNTPALVGAGASAVASGRGATEADLAWAERVLGAVGIVERVPETLLDAVTGLSGSGPAYVFLLVEALIEGGVLVGLPRATASRLAIQTVLGSAKLLDEGTDGPEALRAAVTSPGGTTAAGLRALEDRGVRAAFLAAVDAATRRSHELG